MCDGGFLKTDVLFTIGGKNFHLPKLIGAFLVFGAVLMLFQGVAQMFDSWDALKDYPKCVDAVQAPSSGDVVNAQFSMYKECKEILYRKTGIQLLSSQVLPSARQKWIALIGPIAGIFFWSIMFFFGIMLYNTGKIVIPVEHSKPKKKRGK